MGDPRRFEAFARFLRHTFPAATTVADVAGIERVSRRVEDTDLRPYDLVAALHPDAATEPAVRAAVALGVDFAVVPCCVFPLDGVPRSREAWLRHLQSLAPGARVGVLPIAGANRVLWRRGAPAGSARPACLLDEF